MDDYEYKTVVELKALAKKRSVRLPYNATKDQIIATLETADKPKPSRKTPTTMSNEKENETKKDTSAKESKIKWSDNPENPGKADANLYQKGPGMRAWLTDDEAKDEGFNVAEKPKAPKDQAKSG